MQNQMSGFGGRIPPVVKNLLIINVLAFLATVSFALGQNIDITKYFGLHLWIDTQFNPYQVVTHLFLHGSELHLLFNMFMLWMFGAILENVFGQKRFLIYYFLTGLGAAFLYSFAGIIALVLSNGQGGDIMSYLFSFASINTNYPVAVGASGAIYGLLMAFGFLFPNQIIYIYFLFPLKAKYLVVILGAAELFMGLQNNPTDNVAHFAHLGGMIFGFILLKLWKVRRIM
ncbi:MAG: rhomboid family intramembrane serine protease [Chitinophagales bacterium]